MPVKKRGRKTPGEPAAKHVAERSAASSRSNGDRLTTKQQAFVDELPKDFNAAAAARRAGYAPRYADRQAWELLENPRVQAAIKVAIEARKKRLQIEVDDVLRLLLKEAGGLGQDTSSAARVRATELLGKHLGMFVDRHQIGGDIAHSGQVNIRLRYELADGRVASAVELSDGRRVPLVNGMLPPDARPIA